jgi:hypothetical protein
MINKKIAKEILEDLNIDKIVSEVVLSVLTLKDKDVESEFNLKIQSAEKELDKAKEKYKEKREKALNDSHSKVIIQILKDLKFEIPSKDKIEDSKEEALKVEEVVSTVPENTNFGNRDFNGFNQSRY